jgi:hypothetical protein
MDIKHSHHLKDADVADFDRAAGLIADGRALRARVFARLRARAFRLARKDKP